MIVFKTAYRAAGFVPCDDELPDYLPMVLDFADLCPDGERLLHAHRADLELLRREQAPPGAECDGTFQCDEGADEPEDHQRPVCCAGGGSGVCVGDRQVEQEQRCVQPAK